MWWTSLVDLLSAVGALAHSHLALLALRLANLDSDAGRPVAGRTHEHHARDRQRRRLLDDAARRERDDLHEVLLAQLAGDRAEDAGSARVALIVDDHRGVLVEGDLRSVVAAERLARANDDGLHDLALLHGALRRRALDRRCDDVAHARVAALRSTRDADAEQLTGARVVGDPKAGFLLDHRSLSLQIALDAGEKQAA